MTTYSFEPTQVPTVTVEHDRGAPGSGGVAEVRPPGGGASYQPLHLEELATSSPNPVRVVTDTPPLDDLLDEARATGWREGLEEGRRLERERLAQSVEALKGLLESIEGAAASREQEARGRVLALSVGIATHLLEREVRTAPEIVSDLVRKAIAEFPVRDPLRVHMNPSDLAILSSGADQEPARGQLTRGQTVRWVPDPDIRSGGCLVEGPERIVDGRIVTVVERIWRVLANV